MVDAIMSPALDLNGRATTKPADEKWRVARWATMYVPLDRRRRQ
jgi:hypothetical protein